MKQMRRLDVAFYPTLTGAVGIQVHASAAVMDEKIQQAITRHRSKILVLLPQTHQYAELGNREIKTAKLA